MSKTLREIKAGNFEFYMENFEKIRTKSGELVNFKLNYAQKRLAEVIKMLKAKGKPVRVIILKARQFGISTFTEGYFFFDTATLDNRNTMVIAHEDKATQNLFSMSKLMYDELPDVLRPMKKYSNEKALVFENPTNNESEKQLNPGLRSKYIVATAGNVDTGRSFTIHNLHGSEVAFWQNAKTIMTGLMQAVPDLPNTNIIIESTANGIGGYFYDMWMAAVKGENDFYPLFLPWFENPEYSTPFDSEIEKIAFIQQIEMITYDSKGKPIYTPEHNIKEAFNLTYEQLNWRRKTIKNKLNGDEELFQQEYPATPEEAFIASGRPAFNISALKKYKSKEEEGTRGYLFENKGKITFVPDPKGYIEIFKEPVPNKFYCIGADVAEGLITGDYSAAAVGDPENYEIVAAWHGHIDPDLFGIELIKLAKHYNDAYIGVEANNHGLTTLKKIQAMEYWNVYYQKVYDQITEKVTAKLGWHTNLKTKPLMINKLGEFLREMYLITKWKTFISECFTYVIEENGSTNAQLGSNDDTVMAVAVLLQVMLEGRNSEYEPEQPKDEYQKIDPYEDLDEKYIDNEGLEIAE